MDDPKQLTGCVGHRCRRVPTRRSCEGGDSAFEAFHKLEGHYCRWGCDVGGRKEGATCVRSGLWCVPLPE